jgi:hypothetical protein
MLCANAFKRDILSGYSASRAYIALATLRSSQRLVLHLSRCGQENSPVRLYAAGPLHLHRTLPRLKVSRPAGSWPLPGRRTAQNAFLLVASIMQGQWLVVSG